LKLDETDYRILTALQRDGRSSFRELAKDADVSVPTVRSRIKRLMDLGIIKQFTVVIDQTGLEGEVSAFISLRGRIQDLKSLAETLKSMEEVSEAYFTTGEYNLLIKVSVPSLHALEEFTLNELSKIPGVEYSRSSVIVGPIKQQYGPTLRPGFSVRINCETCGKEIQGEMVKVRFGRREHYFCCNSCAGIFRKDRGLT